MINSTSKIFIAGHNGMVGSAIKRHFEKSGFINLVCRAREELNLLDSCAVNDFFLRENIEIVILAAAKVGGIQANISSPATFLYENLVIQNNIIHSAFIHKVKKVLFLGSSCIYPKDCPQPMREEHLLTGTLEPTNEGYALAKIVGLKLLESYNKQFGFDSISLMPCNLYGTNDSFHPNHSHVLSSLVKKFVDAVENDLKEVVVWGTGVARREFMHVDDVAEATLFFLNNYKGIDFINIGWGDDVSIKELAELIANECSYKGKIVWDIKKPDGMLRKCMDVTKMNQIGYFPKIDLKSGIRKTINEYKTIINTI
jgi:GDP-L-fucose synthase